MWRARLSVWIFLFISLRTIQAQLCLNNNNNNNDKYVSDINNQLIALQRKANQQNQISNNNGSPGINLVLQNNKLMAQQVGNSQRNAQQSCQQVQQPIRNQQQSLTNQNLQQSLTQQQSNNGQLQTPLPVTNLQLIQTPVSTSEMTFSPLPMINNQFSSLPSQVSQGVLLSNLGLTSSLPSLLPNACGGCVKQTTEQQHPLPQNSVSSYLNVPINSANTQGAIPVSIATSPVQQQKCSCGNNYQSPMFTVPANLQNSISQQNQQVLQLPQTVTITQSQSSQNQNQLPTICQQMQQQPLTQNQVSQSSLQTQPSLPCFSLTSNPPQYPVSSTGYPSNIVLPQNSNYGTKSSSMKSLLPLLVNLIKDKSCCNNCQPNNCGCMNTPCNVNNVQQPQILSGYSNAVKVAPVAKEENVTETISGEKEISNETNKNTKQTDLKDRNEEEDDDDEDYYDDFDESNE